MDTSPKGAVVIGHLTAMKVKGEAAVGKGKTGVTYEDIGGLQKEIQRLVEWIKIYPLTEKYEPGPVEVEEDIYRVMESKFINKIRIKYKNIEKLTILPMVQYLDGTVNVYKLATSQKQ